MSKSLGAQIKLGFDMIAGVSEELSRRITDTRKLIEDLNNVSEKFQKQVNDRLTKMEGLLNKLMHEAQAGQQMTTDGEKSSGTGK